MRCPKLVDHYKVLLEEAGHTILWLPTYSPDLNPIEQMWAWVKFLRQGWMENNLPKLFHNRGCISFIID
ncbi:MULTISPECIES: transposase [unclassified Psychrobacter]|uniref:transposase n=1 Tax=unclassified Psychrobacter TaxID=196806 RepID=UPI0025B61CFB|nr:MULTISPECIES: transposase [unclassified Psychrobacter]MDN3454752.1 transposase [Psychrobacter sp. APC 3350]MDN3503919.1 transposase [Psychrobacter sp. 5A.1]